MQHCTVKRISVTIRLGSWTNCSRTTDISPLPSSHLPLCISRLVLLAGFLSPTSIPSKQHRRQCCCSIAHRHHLLSPQRVAPSILQSEQPQRHHHCHYEPNFPLSNQSSKRISSSSFLSVFGQILRFVPPPKTKSSLALIASATP